jgi:hypothetical protein
MKWSDLNGNVVALAPDIAEGAAEVLARDGWHRVDLPAEISSRADFFQGVGQSVPLDPPLGPVEVWDALSDSLFEGLLRLEDRQIVILWPDAARLRERDPEAMEVALDVLGQVVKQLASSRVTVGRPKKVLAIVAVDVTS